MQRYCVDCQEIYGCVSDGKVNTCFESESDHCTNIGVCLDRINFNLKEVTGGICNGCMRSINIRRVLAGKKPIEISAPHTHPISA
jgi:hypothetical protein